MDQPRVSVLITSYNHEQYIEQAILSAVSQDYDNLLVVSGDGSSDKFRLVVLY